ncbi:MAG TPA: CocE/NonD family hydrolase, partial [Actinomycetota bacterium]|nr:CocE/NonD family hydrolase [Actinomycetota bacterium]
MRDGVELSVDLWRPVVPEGMKVPVILSLTPYHVLYRALDPVSETDLPGGDAAYFVPRGYAYARADVRGTYLSGGCWDYGGLKERQDGYDLVEWLGTRAWSNGKVAMTGASYDGTTANAAAVEAPPHLATIVPVSAISRWWGYAYQQGARSSYSGESADIDPPSDTPTDFMFLYGGTPPPDPAALSAPQQIAMRWNLCDRVQQTLHGYDTEPDYDDFWKERDYLRLADRVKVPVLVTHGQLDFNVKTWEGTQWFQALDTEKVMVIGQWPHASPRGNFPGWDNFLRRWFERWLLGQENGIEDEPAVRVQTNDRVWRSQETWGPTRTDHVFLAPNQPITIVDDGLLTESEMLRGVGAGTRFIRVPLLDTSDLRLAGRPVLNLVGSASLPSTHFVAVLCDVGPDGACSVVSRAFLNARYKDSLEQGKDLVPNAVYTFKLEFIDKDHIVAPGHHLELLIASSSNTWVLPDELRSQNTIYTGNSWVDLPLITTPTSTEVSAPAKLASGQGFTATLRVLAGQVPAAGVPVAVTWRGETFQATTDAQGEARVSFTAPSAGGEEVLTATFRGNRRLDPSGASTTLAVG